MPFAEAVICDRRECLVNLTKVLIRLIAVLAATWLGLDSPVSAQAPSVSWPGTRAYAASC